MIESILSIIAMLVLLILVWVKEQQVNKLKTLLKNALDDGESLTKLADSQRLTIDRLFAYHSAAISNSYSGYTE